MAEVVQEKTRGMKFAEQQLLRHGWEHGKGLGRAENGISEAIKVKVKCDKGGVGHKEGEQFTFHWWDHVFNKSSSSLQVESDENGIKVKKTAEEDGEDGMISNKKPRKAALAKAKLYGCFVKSATLLSGEKQPEEPKSSSSDDSSSSSDEDDDHRLDLSSATKLSDADLVKACGGRTAHKGARHGLTMSAKLARLEQQEAEFMAKYGKKSQPQSGSLVCSEPAPPTVKSAEERVERQEETAEDTRDKKMLKKKKKKSAQSVDELNSCKASESTEADVKTKKKKKKKQKDNNDAEESADAVCAEDVVHIESSEADCSHQTKRKEKKKNKVKQKEEETTTTLPSPAAETAELQPDAKVKKMKRKKRHSEEDPDSSQSKLLQDCAPNTREGADSMEEAEVKEEETTANQKRTKCKKEKSFVDVDGNEEALPPKKKKKKKSKE